MSLEKFRFITKIIFTEIINIRKLVYFHKKILSIFKQQYLKVPKRGIFVTELFTLSDPTWVGDLRNEPKKPFV
jgi:hypothetical protein